MKQVRHFAVWMCFAASLCLVSCGGGGGGGDDNVNLNGGFPSQSSTIQISEDDELIFVVNKVGTGQAQRRREVFLPNGSLTVIRVRNNGQDDNTVLAEIIVGRDPYSVSVLRDGSRAFVSNGADNTVSVIDLTTFTVITDIAVGSEPRGTALSPSGNSLYVANYSDGTLTEIDTRNNTVVDIIDLIFNDPQVEDPIVIENPYAVAITDDDDGDDDDETIYVGDFFARGIQTIDLDQREGFDDGKEARIAVLRVGFSQVLDLIRLLPVADTGFNASRVDFIGTVFGGGANVRQGAFFNQLHSFAFDADTNRLYVPTIGASPEPPVQFDVNVHSLIGVINIINNRALQNEQRNINELVVDEPEPVPPFDPDEETRLDRAFSGDTIAMAVKEEVVLLVSRSGSFCARGFIRADNGTIDLEKIQTNAAIRIPVGNIPNGIVINSDASRAYVNAEVSQTVTAIELVDNEVINTIESADLPAAGSEEHQILLGKLAFFTGMGVPAENLLNEDVRNIDTHTFRNIASRDNWSSCASCHPSGLSDGVTWIFGTGPRQTLPLNGTFSPNDPTDQRALNWNAIRSSITDFNNNSRNVQSGFGFSPAAITAARNPNIEPPGDPFVEVPDAFLVEDHGPDQNTFVPDLNRTGISDSLNLMTLWVQKGIRTFNRPSTLNQALVDRGRTIFGNFCVDCHNGDKWTSSQVVWNLPLFFKGGEQANADDVTFGDERAVIEFVGNPELEIIRVIGTLDTNNDIEVRGAGDNKGDPSLGFINSFNPPSLLGIANFGPFGHHGRAETLEDVFFGTGQDGLGHPPFDNEVLEDLDAVVEFLKAIDEDEVPF